MNIYLLYDITEKLPARTFYQKVADWLGIGKNYMVDALEQTDIHGKVHKIHTIRIPGDTNIRGINSSKYAPDTVYRGNTMPNLSSTEGWETTSDGKVVINIDGREVKFRVFGNLPWKYMRDFYASGLDIEEYMHKNRGKIVSDKFGF
jgi:hypothetical protein